MDVTNAIPLNTLVANFYGVVMIIALLSKCFLLLPIGYIRLPEQIIYVDGAYYIFIGKYV